MSPRTPSSHQTFAYGAPSPPRDVDPFAQLGPLDPSPLGMQTCPKCGDVLPFGHCYRCLPSFLPVPVDPPPPYAASPELRVLDAIEKLDDAARARVIRFAISKWGTP